MRLVTLASLVLVAVVAALAQRASALTFTLEPGTSKCFTDELTQSHRIHLDYSMSRARSVFTSVHITDPSGRSIYDEKRSTHTGHFVFHPATPGEHAVCFVSTERRAPVKEFEVTFTLLAEFEVQSQRSMQYLSSSAAASAGTANQKNKALMVQAKYASENLFAIAEEFRGHMDREARMRITTESAFTRSNVMTFISVLIIGCVTYFGYLTLKRHLIKMKLLE